MKQVTPDGRISMSGARIPSECYDALEKVGFDWAPGLFLWDLVTLYDGIVYTMQIERQIVHPLSHG